MDFSFTSLGISAATPAFGRNLSAHIVSYDQQPYLIDCGEGTQFQLQKYLVPTSKINQIFISHLHGDHYFGIFGLLTSFSLHGRTAPLEIFAPDGLAEILNKVVTTGDNDLSYSLTVHTVDTTASQIIWENAQLEVLSVPLRHRIPCNGFLFKEKERPLNINPEMISRYGLSYDEIKKIKSGANYITTEGENIPNIMLTLAPKKTRSLAYCSDTAYFEPLLATITGVDLLYHEATFDSQQHENAQRSLHSTAAQAAKIAALANVKKLILGHFSPRYKDLTTLYQEASEIFSNIELASEGKTINL